MAVSFELPNELERLLRGEFEDLDRAAKEALLLRAYSDGKLSLFELSRGLGINRFETDALLKRHNIFDGSLTPEDLEEDRNTIDEVLGPVR